MQEHKDEISVEPLAQAKALQEIKARAPGLRVSLDPIVGSPRLVRSGKGFLTGAGGSGLALRAETLAAIPADDSHRIVKGFLNEHAALFGFGAEGLDHAVSKSDTVNARNGLRSMVWQQQLDGIPIFQALLIAHLTSREELVNISSRFLPDPAAAVTRGGEGRWAAANLSISAKQAVALAAVNVRSDPQVGLAATEVMAEGEPVGATRKQHFTASGLTGTTRAQLTWLPMNRETMRLCWDVVLVDKQRSEMFRLLVDAVSGEVVIRYGLTEYLSDASYRVFTSDSPSPFSPGHATPLTSQPPVVARTLVVTSAVSTNASPLGWITDGDNTTLGNNADAHLDLDANDVADPGSRHSGSPFRVFDFPMDLSQAPSTYTNATVTQLFYLNNWVHDKLYDLGFTEAERNFQTDNFGRGGIGNDAVQADAQDGSGVNNANFSNSIDDSESGSTSVRNISSASSLFSSNSSSSI